MTSLVAVVVHAGCTAWWPPLRTTIANGAVAQTPSLKVNATVAPVAWPVPALVTVKVQRLSVPLIAATEAAEPHCEDRTKSLATSAVPPIARRRSTVTARAGAVVDGEEPGTTDENSSGIAGKSGPSEVPMQPMDVRIWPSPVVS